MSTTTNRRPDGRATSEQRRELYDLAVEVRRTVPRELTVAEADALLAEFRKLPKPGLDTPTFREHRRGGRQVRAKRAARAAA